MSRILIALLRVYQTVFSPWLGNQCRFAPTCSAYAREAIERHGALSGTGLAAWRLLRCHPWHPGGIDPVPQRLSWRCVCGADGSGGAPPQAGSPAQRG